MRTIFVFCLLSLGFLNPLRSESISEEDLRQHIAVLASDEFGGRQPGTDGENKTVSYIASEWSKAGLQPVASGGSWYEPVVLIERKPIGSSAIFSVNKGGRQKDFTVREKDLVMRGRGEVENRLSIPVVFAGYGNEGSDELKKLVAGKVALLPLRKPSGRKNLPDYQERRKNLVRAGATAVISIVDGEARWNRLKRFVQRGNMTLDGNNEHAMVEGIISQKLVQKLLKRAGLKKHHLKLLQDDPDFRVTELPMQADLFAETDVREIVSHNVVGKLQGLDKNSGAIVLLGHWDHFGQCREVDPDNPDKDVICNGAVDNASGIALLIETAKRLATTNHDRDIYFLATTAEERGLLGAYAFIRNPTTSIENIVAAFNADSIAMAEDGKRIAVIGLGETELDVDIEKIAAMEDREIDRSGNSNAFLKRQDGYAFLESGVPSYMISSAFAAEEKLNAFINGPYHDVGDELSEALPLGGAAADANFHVALGRYFASTETFPQKASGE